MEPIHSGTTRERIIRLSILSAMVIVFSLLFLKDGYYGYPRKNLAKLTENLDPVPKTPPPINPAVTHRLADTIEVGSRFEDVVARLGAPGWQNAKLARYFGPGGMLTLHHRVRAITEIEWLDAHKSEFDLLLQKILGFALGGAGLILLWRWWRAVRTRVILSDAGLSIDGAPPVPFAAMQTLRADHYRKKGFVDLDYQLDGRWGTLRLDDYLIKEFRPIVTEICKRAGFDDPVGERPATFDAESSGPSPSGPLS